MRLGFLKRNARFSMGAVLAVADLLSLFIANGLAILFWFFVLQRDIPIIYLEIAPFMLVAWIIFYSQGLYSPGLNPVEELRKTVISITAIFLLISMLAFWLQDDSSYQGIPFFFAWFITLFLMPINRSLLRHFLVYLGIWGESVAVIGYGLVSQDIITYFLSNPTLGIIPVLAIATQEGDYSTPPPITVLRYADITNDNRNNWFKDIQTAFLITPDIPEKLLQSIGYKQVFHFKRLVVISDAPSINYLRVRPLDIDGILGVEVYPSLLNSWQKALKRIVDISIVLLSSIFVLPLIAVISIIIRLDSQGDIFFSQTRMGKNGRPFKMWKFRTMHPNAAQMLQQYLENDPKLHEEWKNHQKLKNDLRITRVGRILRKTSMDELPQLWNILKGEMSMVGPRPIFADDIQHYGDHYKFYCQLLPGLTGYWQINGRSDTCYEKRVAMDNYYFRNWSIWLDIYILARTVLVVLRGQGSY
jgi:Undecaprenyl-phosphate galactose phosphotransferase WbaP